MEARKQQEAIKEHEKELKEEKEAERQVRNSRSASLLAQFCTAGSDGTFVGAHSENQGPQSREGREGAV